jgi:hypothetical protein
VAGPKREVNRSSGVNQTTRCNIPEDRHIHARHREKLKSHLEELRRQKAFPQETEWPDQRVMKILGKNWR